MASGQDLKAVVRARAAGQQLPDVPLTRGWRSEAILSEILAILDGKHALRIVQPSSNAPLAYLPVHEAVSDTDVRTLMPSLRDRHARRHFLRLFVDAQRLHGGELAGGTALQPALRAE